MVTLLFSAHLMHNKTSLVCLFSHNTNIYIQKSNLSFEKYDLEF